MSAHKSEVAETSLFTGVVKLKSVHRGSKSREVRQAGRRLMQVVFRVGMTRKWRRNWDRICQEAEFSVWSEGFGETARGGVLVSWYDDGSDICPNSDRSLFQIGGTANGYWSNLQVLMMR